VRADVQGSYLVRTIRLLRARFPYVRRAYWYKLASSPIDDAHEAGYGLLRQDLTPRPAYSMLKLFLRGQPSP
jgi:hypothetical protein